MTIVYDRHQKEKTHPSIVQLHRNDEFACLVDGSATSMLRTTPIWYANKDHSPDAYTSSCPSRMRMPRNLDQYHDTVDPRCGCHVSSEVASIAYHGYLVLLNWLFLGTTTCDAINGKNHYRFHSFFHSFNKCELSSENDSWEQFDRTFEQGSKQVVRFLKYLVFPFISYGIFYLPPYVVCWLSSDFYFLLLEEKLE